MNYYNCVKKKKSWLYKIVQDKIKSSSKYIGMKVIVLK